MPMTKRRYPALLVLLASLSAMTGCQDTPRALQQARDTLARTLPAPYFEDLVTESVSVEGDRLVLLVRSPTGDADKTRQVPGFDALPAAVAVLRVEEGQGLPARSKASAISGFRHRRTRAATVSPMACRATAS